MSDIKLSIVIPDWKDPYSMDTIRDILKNSELGDRLEIIEVFDGQWPTFEIIQDPRVRYVHLGANRGMRGAINAGIAVARGEFFMRLDEHVLFSKGFDKVLTDECQTNWIISGQRYFLDPTKWKIMEEEGHIDIERLVIQDMGNGVRKFSGQKWNDYSHKHKDTPIVEGQAIQGSMWVANRKFWLKTCGELSSVGYGPTYQDSVEVCMKYWQVGGKLMITKNCFYAHKHRSFSRTHQEGTPENPSNREASWKFALDTWESYYKDVLLPKWAETFK